MLKKFIGDRAFYRRVLILMLPILIQNGITNFVNMLDNLMVGRIGQVDMIGVSVANQLIFVFNLCVFGAVSGAGIFGAQFAGNKDTDGLRHAFRFKIIFTTALSVSAIALFLLCGSELIQLYLRGDGDARDAEASLAAGLRYLHIMLIGLIPASVVQCYSSTLRETGQTFPPMVAGVIAIFVNLVLNYVLIFGHWGMPELGVVGAALATVTSRFVELFVIVLWTCICREKNSFISGAFKSLYVPLSLVKQIAIKGLPLMLNETMWAMGIACVNQCYSREGMAVVAANNILQTFFNVFSVAFMAVGAAVGIILGQLLGAGKCREARESSVKLISFSFMVSVAVAVLFAVCAEFIPDFYEVDADVKLLATRMMQICALALPLDAITHSSYFTLRSGGQAVVTIIFDSGFVWAVSVPAAFLLCSYTGLTILPIYAICQGLNAIKCTLGILFVRRGDWVKNIVS